MWNASCFKNAKEHVEMRARQRIIHYSRTIYNEILTEKDVKEKILDIMRTSSHKDFIEIDKESALPKYKLRDVLPKSKISVCLYIIEDEKNKERKIKTLLTDWEEKFPNN